MIRDACYWWWRRTYWGGADPTPIPVLITVSSGAFAMIVFFPVVLFLISPLLRLIGAWWRFWLGVI